ncbi:hypothetical protein M3610_23305 [Neobacillus sp. MER 74]|uniref:hypothetical protein n=1 Tax=Neobacillus sp. MER 74 TaxID=2939566 RepID=UPI00204083FB|nr:hypothetical protein [Neobacillus sp. MER 74]MCM3118159.1 hypothetical protein [Neobacillus sp. MER 74]
MAFSFRSDIKELINVAAVRKFAKDHGVDYQGAKNIIFTNILLAVRSERLSEEIVRSFIKEQIWYGKNKHNFFIEVDEETIAHYKEKDSLLEYFSNRGIHPFNNMDRIFIPEGVSLARFEYDVNEHDENLISKLYLGYIEKNYTYHFDNQTPVFEPINTYVCVELDLLNNLLVLRVRSQSSIKSGQDVNSPSVTANYLAKKYLKRFEDDYGFEYLDGAAEEMKNTMYKIEKEMTNFIELQFKPKIEESQDLINNFTTQIAENLNLPSNTEPLNLPERIIGLLERAMIMKNEDVIKMYVEGKKGYVNMFDFKDDRGGRINARSQHRSMPIQTSDIFFDTRETIDEVKLLDNLWVAWFKELKSPEIDEEIQDSFELDLDSEDEDIDISVSDNEFTEHERKAIRIKTKIASYTGYYKMEFKRYLIKEEYNHVLSLIESFR